MRKSNFALRLQPSLLDEVRHSAQAEGVALNQLINVAVAEKISALRTEKYFAERAARANVPKALEFSSAPVSAIRHSRAISSPAAKSGRKDQSLGLCAVRVLTYSERHAALKLATGKNR